MATSKVIISGLSIDEVVEALQSFLPNYDVRKVDDVESTPKEAVVFVANYENNNENAEIEKLRGIIKEKEKQMKDMDVHTKMAVDSIQNFHRNQQQLYEEFLVLRQKYDDQKEALISTLWSHCSPHHPELKFIPQEEGSNFQEDEHFIGKYELGEVLGEGQFATVYSCKSDSDRECALKVINKDRVTYFSSLRRVSNEIDILKKLQSPYIVKIFDVMQSKTKLYIVTEKGGQDLFDFFDEHPHGVQESWAHEIISGVLEAILYCHRNLVCHRDLKPENILLVFDSSQNKLLDLKLCDFGLSTRFKPGETLSDFCGSPGFFAPEMILEGTYFGDRADIWSIGCILLELIMGHERFCDIWMGAYDYEVMQDKGRFDVAVCENTQRLPKCLDFSHELNEFVIRILKKSHAERPNISELCKFPWVQARFEKTLQEYSVIDEAINAQLHVNGHQQAPSQTPAKGGNPLLRNALMSSRERRLMEDYANSKASANVNGHHEINLPPIDPATPSIGKARKIMKKGDQIVNKVASPNSEEPEAFSEPCTPSFPQGKTRLEESKSTDESPLAYRPKI